MKKFAVLLILTAAQFSSASIVKSEINGLDIFEISSTSLTSTGLVIEVGYKKPFCLIPTDFLKSINSSGTELMRDLAENERVVICEKSTTDKYTVTQIKSK